MCGCLLHAPCWGPGPQPRHVSRLGIEPFGSQAGAQSTEPRQPGIAFNFDIIVGSPAVVRDNKRSLHSFPQGNTFHKQHNKATRKLMCDTTVQF